MTPGQLFPQEQRSQYRNSLEQLVVTLISQSILDCMQLLLRKGLIELITFKD